MSTKKHFQEFAGGDVCFWLEQDSSIHLKAISGADPVELTAREAKKIAAALLAAAKELGAMDESRD